MNKKILEDIKISSKIHKTSKEDDATDVHVRPSNSKIYTATEKVSVPNNDSSKYDFLNKLNKKTPSNSYQRIPQTPHMPSNRHHFNKTILLFLIISLFIGSFYLVSTVFFRAKVTVISKNKSFELNKINFTASKDTKSGIPFEVMIVDDTETKDVILTSTTETSEKSKGEITLYNKYSTKPQKVVANSFVSDEKGKTYKTDSAVSIPGYTMENNKVVSGQISVGITAFLPGDAYNGSPESFSINSFKGTAKEKKIYGEIKTPLTGGSAGLVYVLDDKEKELYTSNSAPFKDKLMRKLAAQVPSGYILYPDAVNFSYELADNANSKIPNMKIEMKGTLSAVLLKENDLSSMIIDKLLPEISSTEKAEIINPDISKLTFNFVNNDQTITKDMDSFDFELNGSLPISWRPDLNKLKNLLAGKTKDLVPDIFKQDPGIASANVKIFPFWSKVLPENDKNINIILK